MKQTVICPICEKELEGVIRLTRKSPGRIAVAVLKENVDCNWTQCKSCKTLICKECSVDPSPLCCDRASGGNHQDAEQEKSTSLEIAQETIQAAV